MSDRAWAIPERRELRRTSPLTDVVILIEDPSLPARAVDASVVNVGAGGVLVRIDEGLAEGTLCAVRLSETNAGSVELRGFVRRVRASEGGILVGIEFEAPLETMWLPDGHGHHVHGVDLGQTRVLVVDDERGVVELLYRFLNSRGCVVSTAMNGAAALGILRESAQDITMLDLKMPGMSGLEVLEAVRDEELDAGDIWAISGYASDGDAREALRLGAADFINKPLDLKYLEWSMELHRALS